MKFRDEVPGIGGQFLKIKDGESITGIFIGEVYDYFCLWKGSKSEIVKEGTPGARFRFRINFVVKENDGYAPKIIEQGLTFYNRLKALNSELGLDQIVVKITRSGSTKNDTEYTIDPVFGKDRKLASVPAQVSSIKPLELQRQESDVPSMGDPPWENGESEMREKLDDERLPF